MAAATATASAVAYYLDGYSIYTARLPSQSPAQTRRPEQSRRARG